MGQEEIEFVLALTQGVCIGRSSPLTNDFRNSKIFGKLVNLGFVKMSYRFYICCSVTLLNKKALVVLKTVGVPATA